MDSINFVDLKSDHSDDGRPPSAPAYSLSQNGALNTETSFIEKTADNPPANLSANSAINSSAEPFVEPFVVPSSDHMPVKRTGPSVLLKHNVSCRRLNDEQSLQKSKSTPYLPPGDTQDDQTSNGLHNNNCLTSTPNLSNSKLFSNYDNILKILQTPNSKLAQLIDNDPQTPSKQIKLTDNQTASSASTGLPPAILCRNVSFDYRHRKVKSSNVLRNVNLNCQIGSIYGLLGPSGCGEYRKTLDLNFSKKNFNPNF